MHNVPTAWSVVESTLGAKVTIILTMRTLPLAEMKAKLSALLSDVEREHEQITVTRNGVPSAVVISADEWESLQETLDVLSDQEAVADLKEANRNISEGDLLGTDDVIAEFEQRRGREAE